MKTVNYGLQAPIPIQWLLQTEPEVKEKLRLYLTDQLGTDTIEVAGPPSASDILKYRRNPRAGPGLPVVRLKCRMVRHNLTGDPGVEVTCSDEDLEVIMMWAREQQLRFSLPKGLN